MSEYCRNLIRRAFDNAGERKLTKADLSRFIQGRVALQDRDQTLDAMLQESELTLTRVPPVGPGYPTTVYHRAKVIDAVGYMRSDAGRVRPSGAAQRQSKKTRELAEVIGELRESITHLSHSMTEMKDTLGDVKYTQERVLISVQKQGDSLTRLSETLGRMTPKDPE